MATHSSVLAWRIPGTGEPGGLPSMEPHARNFCSFEKALLLLLLLLSRFNHVQLCATL